MIGPRITKEGLPKRCGFLKKFLQIYICGTKIIRHLWYVNNGVYGQSKTNGSVYVCVFDERKTHHRRTILMAKSITLALKLAFKQPL